MIWKVPETRGSRNLSRCWESETDSLCWESSLMKTSQEFPRKNFKPCCSKESNAARVNQLRLGNNQGVFPPDESRQETLCSRGWLSNWVHQRVKQQNVGRGVTSRARLPLKHTEQGGYLNPAQKQWDNQKSSSCISPKCIRFLPTGAIMRSLVLVCYKLMGTGEPAVKWGMIFTCTEKNQVSDFYSFLVILRSHLISR